MKLNRIHVAGFRSLRDVSLELSPVTILIGPNGAGKSNLLWVLEMVRMIAFDSLQLFVGERGGATFLMHYGPKQTDAIDLSLEFSTEAGEHAYQARLGYGSDESLVFLLERVGFRTDSDQPWACTELGAGHRESRLKDSSETDLTAKILRSLLREINFYHFHDTSRRSSLRTRSYADATVDYLRSDGSNLPAFLLGLRESDDTNCKASWRRIHGMIRRIAPFIRDIVPTKDRHGVSLAWVDERGETFGPAHLSDGTLRAIALVTALGQPSASLPLVSCIDEPELGLHPAAVEILCGLISSVSARHQVIVSTQSPAILDLFEPNQVVVAERENQATVLRRLEEEPLKNWLEHYTLSTLYNMNILGGRP